MKRPHRDRRYYACPKQPCRGEVVPIGQDMRKQSVYECPVCKRRCGESVLLMAYRQVRLQD